MMIEFYKKMANNPELSEEERNNYKLMAERLQDKVEVERLKKAMKDQYLEDLKNAEDEDDGCSGGACRI